MKIKKYTGNSLTKIQQLIYKELGKDAIIIKSEEKTPEKKGFISSNKNYEVIAATEEVTNTDNISSEKISESQIKNLLAFQKKQYCGMSSLFNNLQEQLASVDVKIDSLQQNHSPSLDYYNRPKNNVMLQNVDKCWHKQINKQIENSHSENPPVVEDWRNAIASVLPTAGGIMFKQNTNTSPDVYVVAGPTGVGKTTTIAKLAAKCALKENLKVGLITIDTFRVGAVDQLREYSTLLGIELSVAFSFGELEIQLENFQDKDVVFIDTPGRSQFDFKGINQIADVLKVSHSLCTILAIPANVREEDAETIAENYNILSPSAIILTKTDETSKCDGITKLLHSMDQPVVYVTNGQKVPEDIHEAEPIAIATMIMGETGA